MTQNKTVLGGIMAVIILMGAGYWFVTTNQYASALMGTAPSVPETTSSQDGISGATKQTDNPLVNPYGASAGGIVDAHTMTVAQVVANLDATEFASLFSSMNGAVEVSGTGKF